MTFMPVLGQQLLDEEISYTWLQMPITQEEALIVEFEQMRPLIESEYVIV